MNYFINVKHFFSISQLNSRIFGFNYLSWENKPVEINVDRLKSKLKLSTAETMTLLRNFNLLIGDLVPADDNFWHLFIKLKILVETIMAEAHTKNSFLYLAIIIEEYSTLLNELLPYILNLSIII